MDSKSLIFSNQSFKLLTLSSLFSLLSDQLALVTLPWLVMSLSSDPVVLGSMMGAFALPMALFMLPSGVLVDKYSPKKALFYSRFISFIALMTMAILLANNALSLTILYILVLILGACTAFFATAINAILPRVVGYGDLQPANGILMVLRSASTLVGPIIAGYLLKTSPALENVSAQDAMSFVLMIASVCFFLSTIFIWKMSVTDVGDPGKQPVLRGVIEALSHVWNNKRLRLIILYSSVAGIIIAGPMQVALPLLVKDQLGGGPGTFATFISVGALGSMAGMFIAIHLPDLVKLKLGVMILAIDLLAGILLVSVSFTTTSIYVGAVLFTLQMLSGYAQVATITWIQHQAPKETLGRVMSVVMFPIIGLLPLSSALTGFILKFSTSSQIFFFAGIFLAGVSGLALVFSDIVNVKRVVHVNN